MSTARLLFLAAIAGGTIFLGLPLGRVRGLRQSTRTVFNAAAAGIFVFLLAEVLTGGAEGVKHALQAATAGTGTWGDFSAKASVFGGGVAAGLLSLNYYQRWMQRSHADGFVEGGIGPGSLSPGRHLALLIAVGIGFHNFAEGLAIGQSVASGHVSLALLLIIGFALHNGTEGFGIAASPATRNPGRASSSWRCSASFGGAPTFLGTIVGRTVVNETLAIGFLALAGGSILFVVIQLFSFAAKSARPDLLCWGLLGGLVLGYGTDFVLAAAGA